MTRSLNEGGKPPPIRHIVGDRYTSYGHRHEADDVVSGTMAMGRIAVFIAFLAVIAFLARTLPHLFSILNTNIESKVLLALIGAFGSFSVGVGLYYFRERKRMLYSLLEMAVGFVTGGVAILRVNTQGDLSVWLGLSASAYLVVRGLDNLQKAKEQRTNRVNPPAPSDAETPPRTEAEQIVGGER